MNCASITISAGKNSSTPFAERPEIFKANNIGKGGTSVKGKEVQFPNQGPVADVTIKNTGDDLGPYTGNCN